MFPEGTPVYKPYRYMPPQGVLFLQLRRFGLKTGIDFARLWSRTGYGFRGNFGSTFPNGQGRKRNVRIRNGFYEILAVRVLVTALI